MKQLFLIFMSSVLITGCVSANKYIKIVDGYTTTSAVPASQNERISITVSGNIPENNFHDIDINRIPAVVFWRTDVEIATEINRDIRLSYVTRGIQQAAFEENLEQYLDNKTLHIHLKDLPGVFRYEFNRTFIPYPGIDSEIHYVFPSQIDLLYEYKVNQGEWVTLNRSGRVKNQEYDQTYMLMPDGFNNYFNPFNDVKFHLAKLEDEAFRMGKQLVYNIIADLDKGRNRSIIEAR